MSDASRHFESDDSCFGPIPWKGGVRNTRAERSFGKPRSRSFFVETRQQSAARMLTTVNLLLRQSSRFLRESYGS